MKYVFFEHYHAAALKWSIIDIYLSNLCMQRINVILVSRDSHNITLRAGCQFSSPMRKIDSAVFVVCFVQAQLDRTIFVYCSMN